MRSVLQSVVLCSRARVLLPAVAGLAWAAAAGAVAWPGAPPCNGTLQACIDGVPAGSVVQMSSAIADEDLTISKSLTLEPAPGKLGVIGGTATTRVVQVQDQTPRGSGLVVQIRDLTLDNALVSVSLSADSGHQVTVRGCSIRNEEQSNNTRAIDLSVTVPATIGPSTTTSRATGTGSRCTPA